jgi:glycosyltransferase involved in cell wall biosynthesis
MDILLISVVFPYPVDAGGSVGTHKMIEFLRKNHNITLVCPKSSLENQMALEALWPNVKIVSFNLPCHIQDDLSIKKIIKSFAGNRKISKEQRFRNAMMLQTSDLVNYYFDDLLLKIGNLTFEKKYDLIQVEFIDLAPIVNFLPKNTPKIFIHHEIRYKRMFLEYSTLKDKTQTDIWKIENTKTLEIATLNKYDKVISLTEHDKNYLIADGVDASKVEVSPLPINIKNHPINIPFNFQNRLVYLGPEIHFPNLDAIDWFLTHCWNDLKSQNPKLKLEIIGKWQSKTIQEYSHFKDVTFLGFVEKLENVMTGAIMIVPLRIGSGMRMKILEGVSWHVPIVSTSIGAEGLPMHHNENCFLADNPGDFCESILKISKDKELQNSFIDGSKNLIQSGYSIEDCGKKREEIFKNLIQ